MAMPLIKSIETWALRVPLGTTLHFGHSSISARDHVALRVIAADGKRADCLGLSRGAPIDVALIDQLAPHLSATESLDREQLIASLRSATAACDQDGVLGRAISMLEVCLWDLEAQEQGEPLWRHLGAPERDLPVMLIEGYALPGESDEEFVERFVPRADQGFTAFKIEAASYRDPLVLLRRLDLLRRRLGDRPAIAVDFAWTLDQGSASRTLIEALSDYALVWVEDPLPRLDPATLARLRQQVETPLAGCDELSRPADLERLLEERAVDILRLDATVCGGISEALRLAELAMREGVKASFHEHPEIHRHLAQKVKGDFLEVFPDDRPFDCAAALLESSPAAQIRAGRLSPSDTPGSGVRLDDDALRRYWRRHEAWHLS